MISSSCVARILGVVLVFLVVGCFSAEVTFSTHQGASEEARSDVAFSTSGLPEAEPKQPEPLSITPLGPNIGAEIRGLNLSSLTEDQFELIQSALLQHHVLFVRDFPVTPAEQRDLASRFAKLHIHPLYTQADGVPEIVVLDTDEEVRNDHWHTDVTFQNEPPLGALLSAKLVPPYGGDTIWCSGFAAFEALSEPFKQLLEGLEAEHDFRVAFPEELHLEPELHERWKAAVAKNPPVRHPVIRTHPVTGRQALFVSEGFTTRILGLSAPESRSILNFLFTHIQKPEFHVRWRWTVNDLAIWDNRGTQHYATYDYAPQRRVMHRATLSGDRPFYKPRPKSEDK